LFAGTLIGNPGDAQANGGTLSITGDSAGGSATAPNIFLVQNTVLALAATTAAGHPVNFDFATYTPTATRGLQAIDPNFSAGDLLLGVDKINGSGFSSLVLNNPGGGVIFSGVVSMQLPGAFTVNTGKIFGANAGNFVVPGGSGPTLPGRQTPTTNGASLTVTAPYIAINGSSPDSNGILPGVSSSPPPAADASLTLNAGQLDLSAAPAISGYCPDKTLRHKVRSSRAIC
jgi:hypothetical protein